MLNDIFTDRYSSITLWNTFTENDKKFLTQCFRIISEQLFPYWSNGKENTVSKRDWTSIHDNLCMELGLQELSPHYFTYNTNFNGVSSPVTSKFTIDNVCKNFVLMSYHNSYNADKFIKDRISFIELAFREKQKLIQSMSQKNTEIHSAYKQLTKFNNSLSQQKSPVEKYNIAVLELNERLKRVKYPLNYHNGLIQISKDNLIEKEIKKAFWNLTAYPNWENVDIDMKKAIHLRDINGPDPAFYAAKALESTIKIVSDTKKWSHGKEKGAHNYIDNLVSKNNGQFINKWESEFLKSFFTNVRNPFGHGAGSDTMPQLTTQQTDWAIETCMSWIKNLINRI